MKRLPVNSRPSQFVEEDSVRFKQQRLLEDYIEVQKEFVARKKKLETAKQKREILLAEVSFLRRRHKYLKMQSQEFDADHSIIRLQSSSAQSNLLVKNGNSGITRVSLKNPSPVLISNPFLGDEDWNRERKEGVILNPLRREKKRKNHAITEKKVRKKKISWQDQVALKV